MNKRQKLVQQQFLDNEKGVIKRLNQVYSQSLKDVTAKSQKLYDEIEELTSVYDDVEDEAEKAVLKSRIQSKVYQKKYQDGLKKQLDGILDKLKEEQFETVSEYLNKCYEDGFIGTLYDLQGQGIPLAFPLDQEAMVRAVQIDSKISSGLYNHLGENVDMLKKTITAQVSRGISSGMTFNQIARQLSMKMMGTYTNPKGSMAYAKRIARTEGHRIQCQSTMDACHNAKDRGADVVKQWDSTLDGKTRSSHIMVDGEFKELDEKFSNGLMFPGDPSGGAHEVCNCRCALLQRARWAVEGGFTKMNNFTKQLETFESPEAYNEFKKGFFSKENRQYMNYVQDMENKYKTKDFEKILKHMDDKEYNHYSKLLGGNPMFNKKTTKPEVFDVNQRGSDLMIKNYESHRLKNNLTSVPYEEMGSFGQKTVGANYGNLSEESATIFNDTLQSLSNEYDTPLTSVRVMTQEEKMAHGNSFAYVSHNYETDTAEMIIHPRKCKDLKELKAKISDLSERGYCANIPDELAEKYVATHEFAHAILNVQQPLNNKRNWANADYDKIRKARKEIEKVHESYMKEVGSLTEKHKKYELEAVMTMDESAWTKAREAVQELKSVKISEYSLENIDEFMAESFVNEKLGTSNKYGKQVVNILDEYFRR